MSAVSTLHAYLLAQVKFDDLLALQHRIHAMAREEQLAAVILCEHPTLLTVGRAGSHRHWDFDNDTPGMPQTPVRWVSRGGGCWLHGPGQMAIYLTASLRAMAWTVPQHLAALENTLALTCQKVGVEQPVHCHERAIWIGTRPVGAIGAAVGDWTTSYGGILNVNPQLEPFRRVRTGPHHPTMTSLQRESRRPLRIARVREVLVEQLAGAFGMESVHVFTDHPLLRRKAPRDAVVAAR